LQKFVVVTLVAESLVIINAAIRPARAGRDDVAAGVDRRTWRTLFVKRLFYEPMQSFDRIGKNHNRLTLVSGTE
jgi:hypothetical protein